MKLTEFIRQNNIKSTDGEAFDESPEFFKVREFERTCHKIYGMPFLDPQTHRVKEFDVTLTGYVQEQWDRFEKKTKQRFFVNRSFRAQDAKTIDDSVVAGRNIDEAIEVLEDQRERFEFFKRYDLIDTGRYWLNRDLKRCLVDEGKVIVID
ncbi:MAG: hypothetical protein P8Z79_00645 [Sedimentisphaerales bacterium]|jgi:hypothetical protein